MDLISKEKILGSAVKIRATHDHEPDIEKLHELLPTDAVIRLFCSGCGTHAGVSQEDAYFLAYLANRKDVESFAGLYFHSGKCAHCDSKDKSLELIDIPAKH